MENVKALLLLLLYLLEGRERISMDKETFIFKLVFGKRIYGKSKNFIIILIEGWERISMDKGTKG